MAENTTINGISTLNDGSNLIWLYVTWICFFFTTSMPNLMVVLTVIRYKALNVRKEYLIMAGLSFSDFMETSAYSVSGFHRLSLIFTDQWNSKSSPWSCVTLAHNVVWWFSAPASGIMLVIVSLDRFISVSSPLKYISLTRTYAFWLLGMVYGYSIFMCLLAIGLGFAQMYGQSAQLAAPCFTGATLLAVNDYYAASYMYVRSVTGVLSVVLYVGVGVAYIKMKRQIVAPNEDKVRINRERKRQRKLTVNLAISCLCTTIFLVIPSGVAFTAELFDLPRWILQYIWLLPPVNPFCNIVIYYKRQPELRKAMKTFLINKTLPPDLNLWNTASVGRSTTNHG